METFKAAFLSSKQTATHLLQASLPMGTFEGLPVYLESQEWVESRKEGVTLLLSEENGGGPRITTFGYADLALHNGIPENYSVQQS